MAPRVVLIPGAWHSPSHFAPFTAAIGRHNIEVDCARSLSTDPRGPISVETDAEYIRRTLLLPHIEVGRDVVVIMHSYSGISGSIAAAGLSKAMRAKEGKVGGIVGLIYLTAFVNPAGKSLKDISGGELAPWVRFDGDLMTAGDPISSFYGECSRDDTSVAIAQLATHSRASFETSSAIVPAWKESAYDGKRAFLYCQKDGAIPLEFQKLMVESSGVDFGVAEIDADHSPFTSRTEQTAAWVAEKIQGFIST